MASLPSMKTPTLFGEWNLFANNPSGTNNMPPPAVPSSTHNSQHSINGLFPPVPAFQLTLNRKPKQQQDQGQSRTLHGNEDLKSYEQAVLARKAPTLLNLVPRRRGTIPSVAAARDDSLSPGVPTAELSRPQSSTSTTSSSSLADALRSSSDSESLASDPPLSSSSRPGTASSHTSDGFHHQTIELSGSHGHGGNSPTPSANPLPPQLAFPPSSNPAGSMAYRPSFKRLASQTLAPDNAKRALLGPAGWDDSSDAVDDEYEDGDEGEADDSEDEHQRRKEERERYANWGRRRLSMPAGVGAGGSVGGEVTLPPLRSAASGQ